MKILKAYKVRLYPNSIQKALLEKTFGCTRFIFNNMLSERKEVYEKFKNDKEQLKSHKYTTEAKFKKDFDWLKEVDSISLQQSRVDLETAYKNFFDSQSKKRKGKEVGYPKFKAKKSSKQSFRTVNVNNNIEIDFDSTKLKLPKLKWINYEDNRKFNGIIKNVTIEKTSTGKFMASILVEEFINTEIHQVNSESRCIGLDYDSKNLFTSNEGKIAGYPKFYRMYEKKLGRTQRKLSRKKKGSANREKQRIKVAKVHEKIKNSRKDFQQKLSTHIVRNYDVIGIETLDMVNMTQSLNLAKSTLDNSWGSFRNMLEYKSEWYGKHLVFADKYYASSKMCNCCGYKNINLQLNDREWKCPICHTEHNRDVNAGKNLMNYAKMELNISTVGTTGINACGDDVRHDLVMQLSANQESFCFS